MPDRLSFYIPRDSLLHRLNPLTKLTFAFTLTILAFFVQVYWLPLILFLAVLVPLCFIGKVWREFFRTTIFIFLPFYAFMFIMQSLFHPNGVTEIARFWIFSLKTEAISFAFYTASRIILMASTFLLLFLTTHPSLLMNDLARRGVPSPLAYIITSTLQILPQMRNKANTIIDAQRSRGLETQGSFSKRVRAVLPLVGPLVFGSLVDVEERAIAIEARGFNSTRQKTSLIHVPDTAAERIARWLLLFVMLGGLGSRLWLR